MSGRADLRLLGIVALGLLLVAPTLGLGFYVDDYVHQLALEGAMEGGPMTPSGLYDFGTWAEWKEADVPHGFPWWIDADWKARFFRPLSSLFLRAQYEVFGTHAAAYHVVSLGLFAALIVACHGLYRALGLGPRGARFGALLVAVCDSAALPVGWRANVNSLLVALFAVASLRLLLAYRGRAAVLALGLLAAFLAVLSKEAGIVSLGLAAVLLAAPPAHVDGAPRPRSLPGAAVAAVAIAVYLGALIAGGYGTRSLFYATPWEDPLRWGANALYLGTAGLASLFGPFPSDLGSLLPGAFWFVALAGAVLGLPVLLWILRAVRGVPGTGLLGLWVVGFTLAQAGAMPSDRLLFVPSIGMAGLLALAFERTFMAASGWRRWARRGLWASAVVGSGLFLLLQSLGLTGSSTYLRARVLETEAGDAALGRRDWIVLQTQSQLQAFALAATWAVESGDRDVVFWPVQAGNRGLVWSAVDAHTFELESTSGPFLTNVFEGVYLSREPEVAVGRTWRTDAFTVEALEVVGGAPTRLRFRTTKALADPTLGFLRSDVGVLRRIEPPVAGESIALEPVERDGPFMP